MAKKETKKEAIEEVAIKEQSKKDAEVGKLKVKKKSSMKNKVDTDEPTKVDLSKPKVKEEDKEITKIDLSAEKSKETAEKIETQDSSQDFVLEEITDEEVEKKPVISKEPELPENIQKVVKFMKDTGGDLNDYINLNQDYSKWDNEDLLRAYYKETKPHLTSDEITFIMEDNFKYDEAMDNENDIKRKKLALKEQVASAKDHLDGLKSKYYEDIRMGSKLTEEQREAIEFFNSYKEESGKVQQQSEKAQSIFLDKTKELFDEGFKGFEYNIGDKRFRFNVKDINKVKTEQSDIKNFVKKFLNEDNTMGDASGYHKSLFTAMNSDAIANHFYEQGKADALKDSIAKSKNVNMDPRQELNSNINTSGIKVRALNPEADVQFKFKKRK